MELDNPVWSALQGHQRGLGVASSKAARFVPEVSPFGGFAGDPGPRDWDDMAGLTGPGATVAVVSVDAGLQQPPDGWTISWTSAGLQMVAGSTTADRPRDSAVGPVDLPVALGSNDVDDMLALVAQSRPGPFSSRTVEFGGYVGIRRGGRLVAMAGERLRPPGFAEISAVTTHPDHRRQGLAELLIAEVAAGIAARGEVPFLHVAEGNADAIRLYRTLGFGVRRTVWFTVLEARAA
jgi:ribosomal protein S18 acetylase RimI-like enzyme